MLTIKIFLASSITEFASQRKELEAFVNSLNNIYVKKGIFFELIVCEDLSNAIQKERSQETYNQEIRDSQYFYVIFGRRAGQFTIEEFDVALASYREKGEPRLYTYFLDLPEGEQPDQSVTDFMHRMETELQHYYNKYTHIDSVKLNLVMELSLDPKVGGTVTLEDGEARVDGTAVISMANIPLYSKNEAVRALLKEQQELEEEFTDLAGLGDSDRVQRLRLRNSTRRNEIAAKLHAMEMDVLGLCSRMEENRRLGKKLNWREAKALELADAGDYEAAKTLLRDEQWQEEVKRAEETIDGAKETIREYISGKKALIQMIRASGVTKRNEREIIDIYEDICGLAQKHLVEVDALYDYADFLYAQKRYTRALEITKSLCQIMSQTDMSLQQKVEIYNIQGILYHLSSRFIEAETEFLRAKKIREKLAEENPAAYLPDLAGSCINLGILYSGTSRFKEAEAEFLSVKEIWEKLAKENPSAYLPYLADFFTNLGNLYSDTSRYIEAETYLLRAKEIREKLAKENPAAYLPDLAKSCDNLGNLYISTSRFKEAETVYLRAKEIWEKLAEENPAAYLPDLAIFCNNLGTLYGKTSRFQEAETELLRAKEIREKLVEENPAAFLSGLASSYNNLGLLYISTSRFKEAEEEYLKAKKIYFDLANKSPLAYLPYCKKICGNLGILYRKTDRLEEAKKEEALMEECKSRLAELTGGEG